MRAIRSRLTPGEREPDDVRVWVRRPKLSGSPRHGRRRDVRFPLLTVAFAAALVAVGIATEATATTTAVPKLRGTIGPGYTISLKNAAGKRVKSLRHGKYTFIVRDKAGIHNFT